MKAKRAQGINRTYIKYFLSYLLIVTVLIFGFFLVLRGRVTRNYYDQQVAQGQLQAAALSEHLHGELLYLSQVHKELTGNPDVYLYDYSFAEAWQRRLTIREMHQYANTSRLVQSIVYLSRGSGTVLSTKMLVTWEDELLYLHHGSTTFRHTVFDPKPLLGRSSDTFIHLSSDIADYLIYFPATPASSERIIFYILDVANIMSQMKYLVSDEVPAIALIDGEGAMVTAVNPDAFSGPEAPTPMEPGVHGNSDDSLIRINTTVYGGFLLSILISGEQLRQSINAAFATVYGAVLALSLLGLVLILVAMRLTYHPLRQVALNLSAAPGTRKTEYLQHLRDTFRDMESQNMALNQKLDRYRSSLQLSLLNDFITPEPLPDMDHFFDPEIPKEIFLVLLHSQDDTGARETLGERLRELIPGRNCCIRMDTNTEDPVFLINNTGTQANKPKALMEVLNRLHMEYGVNASLSRSTTSALDIPALMDEVLRSRAYWFTQPVVDCRQIPLTHNLYEFPRQALERLSGALRRQETDVARMEITNLFILIDTFYPTQTQLKEVLAQSILLDTVTRIITVFNESNFHFPDYSDLYFDTLFLCRGFPYSQKREQILENLLGLIDFLDQNQKKKAIPAVQIRQVVLENYTNPDFSVGILAERFHVSESHMSHIFKKELGQNFSEYLWSLRREKAIELLKDSQMPINDISLAVGYYNSTSFRRKFKQETGLSPSQYREQPDPSQDSIQEETV